MAAPIFRSIWTFILYTLLGALCCTGVVLFTALLSPIYLYRWVVKALARCFKPSLGKAVTARGQFFATELIPIPRSIPTQLPSSRCTIICRIHVSGHLTLEKFSQMITNCWLTIQPGQASFKYPEFQQYPVQWMGFMFWRNDSKFSIENHLFSHKIPENTSPKDCEIYMRDMIQAKLNTPFTYKRSPWEITLIQNSKSSSGENVTVCLCRFHHAMVDGFSILNAILDATGADLKSVGVAAPSQVPHSKDQVLLKTLWRYGVYIPWRIAYDMGLFVKLNIQYNLVQTTPWHAPDKIKTWKHAVSQAQYIPIEKVKFIKNKLGVSFTSVLLSCFGAAAAQSFKRKGYKGRELLPAYTILPVPNHPDKLRNHASGVFLELSTNPGLSPMDRLLNTEELFSDARHNSQISIITRLLNLIFSAPVAPLSKLLCANRMIPAAMSNFPGPSFQIDMVGHKVVGIDFIGGGLLGVNGVSLAIISYLDHIRVMFEAEQCITDESGIEMIAGHFENEMELLYKLAKETDEFV